MLISLKYHTADHLNRFCVGVFVFSVSVVCDRIELYKYQIGLWPDCCGCGMYKGKRERHSLKLVIFLTLLPVYCTFNILISVSIFRGTCQSLWLQHFRDHSHGMLAPLQRALSSGFFCLR